MALDNDEKWISLLHCLKHSMERRYEVVLACFALNFAFLGHRCPPWRSELYGPGTCWILLHTLFDGQELR